MTAIAGIKAHQCLAAARPGLTVDQWRDLFDPAHPSHATLSPKELELQAKIAVGIAARDRVIAGVMEIIYRKAINFANAHPPADPDDLAQEAVLKIVEKFALFDPSRGFRFISYFDTAINRAMLAFTKANGVMKESGCLKSVTAETAAARVKHAGPLASLDSLTGLGGIAIAETIEDHRIEPAAEVTEQDAVVLAVRRCLDRIPKRYRQVIRWKFMEYKTYDEILVLCGRRKTKERIRELAIEGIRWVKQILLSESDIREFVKDQCNGKKQEKDDETTP